jgi:hypothetical protein
MYFARFADAADFGLPVEWLLSFSVFATSCLITEKLLRLTDCLSDHSQVEICRRETLCFGVMLVKSVFRNVCEGAMKVRLPWPRIFCFPGRSKQLLFRYQIH